MTGETQLVTVLETEPFTASHIAKAKQEYEKLKALSLQGMAPIQEVSISPGRLMVVQADLAGSSIKRLLNTREFKIADFLQIALTLSETLGKLHKEGLIHKAINCRNIFVDLTNRKVTLVNFSILNRFNFQGDGLYSQDVLKDQLPYISPETTGRLRQGVDHRSDLYSAGAVFYEMLTGSPPFQSDDPLEMIYAHIAKKPIPPNERNKGIPTVISEMVMKLLSKAMEERYQSGFGLMADFQECLARLQTTGKIESFPLAQKDRSLVFRFPDRLFGREKELAALHTILDRIRNGERISVLISGQAGIGKSVLIKDLHKSLAVGNGAFISGKYEQFSQDAPYHAIFEALQKLMGQILSQDREKINYWKGAMLAALGPNGRIITDLLPEAALIIGQQSQVPALGPEESLNRFYLVMKNFIKVFARPDHPLLIFLDDLQWADAASLGLLKTILCDPEIRFLLVICAFRHNEICLKHSLPEFQKELAKAGVEVREFCLDPLNVNHVNQILCGSLHCEPEKSLKLSELVHKKTAGNPFFINQFMETIYKIGLMRLDPLQGWLWNADEIERIRETDNVAKLMTGKISRLSQGTQALLKTCACFGSRFNLETVSTFLGIGMDAAYADLSEAIQAGLVVSSELYFEFTHDQIQEAIYFLIPETVKKDLHLRIGRFELAKTNLKSQRANIFFIVNQFNLARELLEQAAEKDELAHLNLLAGQAAKSATAYAPAFDYFRTAIELIGDTGWQRNYRLTLSVYTEAVEAAYLAVAFDEMERLAQAVIRNASSTLDKVAVYDVRIKTLRAQNKLLPAVANGIEILKQLGLDFPEKPKIFHLVGSLLKTKFSLFGRHPESLMSLPRMKSPSTIAQIQIMSTVSPAVYWAAPNLLPLLVFQMVRLGIKFGLTPMSPYNFAGYGLILCSIGEIENGYRFGKMALLLLENMNSKEHMARALFVFNTFIRLWKEPVGHTLKPLLAAYEAGVETGDFEFAAFALQIYCFHSFYTCQNLTQLDPEIAGYIQVIKSLKQEPQTHMTKLHHQALLNLREPKEIPWRLIGASYHEEEMLAVHRAAGDRTIVFTLYYYKLMLAYLFGCHDAALEFAQKAEDKLEAVVGSIIVAWFHFYDALNRLAIYEKALPGERKGLLQKVHQSRRRLKRWAKHASSNFQHQYELVTAELMKAMGKDAEAVEAYDRAISQAHQNGFYLEEALANERAALYYASRKKGKLAGVYIREARTIYARWGAAGKAAEINKTFSAQAEFHQVESDGFFQGGVDHSTVVHSLQAISTEIRLDDLLKRLTKIIAENSGADKVLYIAVKDDRLHLAAERIENTDSPEHVFKVVHPIPVEQRSDLLLPVVNYVKRTRKYVVLDDAQNQGDYINDPYVLRYKPRSILCLPVIRQWSLIGILYLENTAAPGVFTLARIEILQLLSSQAAISIENAMLYENLANAGQALKESEKKYRLLAENVSDNIWVFDFKQMKFMYHSPSVLQLRGYAPEEAMSQSLEDILPPESLQKALQALGQEIALEKLGTADPNRTRTIEIENYHKDGSIIWTESRMRFLRDEKGLAVSILGVTRNITARKKAEEEIRKLNIELEQRVAARTAELQTSLETLRSTQDQLVQTEKMAALGGMVAGVAHEINTPIGIGLMASSLLEEKTEASKKLFEKGHLQPSTLDNYFKVAVDSSRLIYNNLKRTAELVSSFKQVAAEQASEQCRWIIVKDYIDELISGLQPKYQKQAHHIKVNCPGNIKMYSDPVFLYKIFTNLIMNSIMHGFEDMQNGEIEIEIWQEETWLVIVYKDNGKGMDMAILQKMYDPFFTTKRARGGTGLGMHIVYNLVSQSLSGKMECTSTPGAGVLFLIRIPLFYGHSNGIT